MVDWVEVGARVRVHRMLKGWSLRQLAERAGVAHSFVADLEEGKKTRPSLEHVGRVATALGSNLNDLIGGEVGIGAAAVPEVDMAEEMDVNLKRIGDVGRTLRPESIRKLAGIVQAIREEAEREYEEEEKQRARSHQERT